MNAVIDNLSSSSNADNRELLGTTNDGKLVFYDTVQSHASTHFADTVGLKDLVREILPKLTLKSDALFFDIDMGRTIGTTDVVTVSDSDELVWAIRTKRFDQGLVPWVMSKPAEPCSYISVSFVACTDGSYELSSAYIGRCDDPPFPQQPHATPGSIPYWNSHAFVWGSQPIEPGTVTRTKPW